jgi:hypothetical protein
VGGGGAGIAVGGRQHLGEALGGQSTHRFDTRAELFGAGRCQPRKARVLPAPDDSYLIEMQSRASTSGRASSQDSGESSVRDQ